MKQWMNWWMRFFALILWPIKITLKVKNAESSFEDCSSITATTQPKNWTPLFLSPLSNFPFLRLPFSLLSPISRALFRPIFVGRTQRRLLFPQTLVVKWGRSKNTRQPLQTNFIWLLWLLMTKWLRWYLFRRHVWQLKP